MFELHLFSVLIITIHANAACKFEKAPVVGLQNVAYYNPKSKTAGAC